MYPTKQFDSSSAIVFVFSVTSGSRVERFSNQGLSSQSRLSAPALDGHFLVIDCPGQVELYTHHTVMREIIGLLTKK